MTFEAEADALMGEIANAADGATMAQRIEAAVRAVAGSDPGTERQRAGDFLEAVLERTDRFDGYTQYLVDSIAKSTALVIALRNKDLRGLPPGQAFRAVVDANRLASPQFSIDPTDPLHRQGAFAFDVKEPGYLAGALAAFAHMVTESLAGKPLTVEGYVTLHDTAVNEVLDTRSNEPVRQGLRDGRSTNFGLFWPLHHPDPGHAAFPHSIGSGVVNATAAGIVELVGNCAPTSVSPIAGALTLTFLPDDGNNKRARLVTAKHDRQHNEDRAREILRRYYDSPRTLEDMARCVQLLDQAHLFLDGNLRTCALALNWLLIEAGRSPTMLWEPNGIDGYDLPTLVRHIEFGQQRWASFAGDQAGWWSMPGNDPQADPPGPIGPVTAPPAPAPGPAVNAAVAAPLTAADNSAT